VHDFTGSHDRAQLSAFEQIRYYAGRQAQAIRDEHERMVEWCKCKDQLAIHRLYSRVGSLTLNAR